MQDDSQVGNEPNEQTAGGDRGSPDAAPLDADATPSPDFAQQNPPEQAIAELSAETLAEIAAPAFQGPAAALWSGVLTFIAILVALTAFMMRGRARRRARLREMQDEEFFQPAGDDAEIVFDAPEDEAVFEEREFSGAQEEEEGIGDRPAEETPQKKGHPFASLFAKKKTNSDADITENRSDDFEGPALSVLEGDGEENIAAVTIEKTETAEEAHIPSYTITEPAPASAAHGNFDAYATAPDHDTIEGETERIATPDHINTNHNDVVEERWRLEEEARIADAEARRAEAEARRTAEEERRRQQTILEEREQRIRDEERKLADRLDAIAHRSALHEQSIPAQPASLVDREHPPAVSSPHDAGMNSALIDIEEALVAQSETLKVETRNILDAFASRFEARLESVTRAVKTQNHDRQASPEHQAAAINALTEVVSQQLSDHRLAVDTVISRLSSRIDTMTVPEDASSLKSELSAVRGILGVRALGPLAPVVQLSDILKNALPPSAYDLNAPLGNNRKTDCLIRLPYPPGPIAVDARFPIETFDDYYKNIDIDRPRADSEFRRAFLRHIVDIAERQIIPDVTSDSAMMFIPSETMYTELHMQFPDVIQDAYRARVWVVSPTTLMATLHTVRAVMRDAKSRENASFIQDEAREVMGEVENLRDRVTNLETHFDRARDDVRNLVSSTNQVYRRAETISRSQVDDEDVRLRVERENSFDRPEQPGWPKLAAVPTQPPRAPSPLDSDQNDRPSFPLR